LKKSIVKLIIAVLIILSVVCGWIYLAYAEMTQGGSVLVPLPEIAAPDTTANFRNY
jgi:hypothetical protein